MLQLLQRKLRSLCGSRSAVECKGFLFRLWDGSGGEQVRTLGMELRGWRSHYRYPFDAITTYDRCELGAGTAVISARAIRAGF